MAAAPWAEHRFTTWKFRPAGEGEAASTFVSIDSSGEDLPHGLLERKRVIDYIFVSGGVGRALGPVGLWSQLQESAIGQGGLPCARYPSDHTSVLSVMAWA